MFNRDYEDAPEPKGKAVAIAFDGPVQSLYSTLAVRLGHSGLLTTARAEMWRTRRCSQCHLAQMVGLAGRGWRRAEDCIKATGSRDVPICAGVWTFWFGHPKGCQKVAGGRLGL